MFQRDYHRHSVYCILPPHVLREIARNGTPEQRDGALRTLAIDLTARTSRMTYQLRETGARQALMAATPIQSQRTIYDANKSETLPGKVVRNEGEGKQSDPAVNEAYDGLGATFDFYLAAYNRNSIDDEGLQLDATVHYGQAYNNAFWNGQQMVFGDGDGVIFNRFTIAVDVIGHELTHGVTGSEANLVYLGESGALNESISDVFGSVVKQYMLKQTADKADWLIGAGLFTSRIKGVALRSMKAPGTAYDDALLGKDPQPADMSRFVHTAQDNGGVHINSGIPNRSFYLLATKLGNFTWEKAGRIWYETVRDRQLRRTATFVEFATRTLINAGHLYGSSSNEAKAVAESWKEVGVKVSTTALIGQVAAGGR